MASSPAARTAPRRSSNLRVPSTPLGVVADLVSFGYALVVVVATLQFDLQFSVLQGVLIMVLFVVLRAAAHEIKRDARRSFVAQARRTAAARSQSPARWSTEQKDGLGRRVDVGA